MKRLGLLLFALLPALHFGCGVDELIDKAESNLSNLGNSLSNLKGAGATAAAPGGATGAEQAAGGGMATAGEPGSGTAESGAWTYGSATCGEVFGCVGECVDDACVENCLMSASEMAWAQLEAVAYCVDNSSCADDACLEQTCANEINSCAMGGGSGGSGGESGESVTLSLDDEGYESGSEGYDDYEDPYYGYE